MISCSPLLLNELNKISVPGKSHPLRSIRTFISGGDVLKREYVNRLVESGNVYNTYGPTETTVCAAYYRCSSPLPDNIPIGAPIANYGVFVLDSAGCLVPMGVAGELCISGTGVTAGYLNRPELTSEKFIDKSFWESRTSMLLDPFCTADVFPTLQSASQIQRGSTRRVPAEGNIYHTGDRARWLPGGILEFLGRVDRQIQLRGFRIEPGEIENRLLEHEGIDTAVVTARIDKTGETSLCAYIVSPRGVDEQELRVSLARVLPDYMIPAYFVELDRLPFTAHGKLDRDALPDPVGRIRGITYVSRRRLERLSADLEKLKSSSLVPAETETAASGDSGFSCYIIGETALAVRCGEILLEGGHRVHGIVSGDSRVLEWARTRGIAFMNSKGTAASRKSGLTAFLKHAPFDYLFSIFSTRILPDEILALPRRCAINFHDALLPRYAGLHVPSWALINREKTHGITWHVVDSGVDTGDILEQVTFPVEDRETAFSLNMKCIDAGAGSFGGLVDRLAEQKEIRRKQDFSQRTYYGKYRRPFAGGLISFREEAGAIDALVRGLDFAVYENPLGMPGIAVDGSFYIVTAVTLPDVPSRREPGTVVAVKEESLVVAAQGGDVEISGLLTFEGETVDMGDFVRDRDIREGYCFPEMPEDLLRRLDEYNMQVSRHEKFWVRRVHRCRPLRLAGGNGETSVRSYTAPAVVDSHIPLKDRLIAAFVFCLSRLTCIDLFDIGYTDPALMKNIRGLEGMFALFVPLRVEVDGETSAGDFSLALQKELARVRKHQTYSRDLLLRFPLSASVPERSYSVSVAQVEQLDDLGDVVASQTPQVPQVQLVIAGEGRETLLRYDARCLDEAAVDDLLRRVSLFLQGETVPFTSTPVLKGGIDRGVRIGNVQVDPAEIEARLVAHEDVDRAAVVVRRHGNSGGKEAYLCACLQSEKRLIESSLRAHLTRYMPLRRQPSHFLQVEEMPLSTTDGENDGDIDRPLLEQVDLRVSAAGEVRGPRDETEEELTRLWFEVLGVSTGIDADFFESGGHSLKATVLLNRVRKVLDVKIPLAEMFKTPTIRGLSDYVKRELRRPTRNGAFAAVEPAPPADYYPLSSAQKRNYVLSQVDKDNLVYNMTEAVIIQGPLDTDRFEDTFRKMIRRHESFRTSFEIVKGEPVQKIHEHVEFKISMGHLGEGSKSSPSLLVEDVEEIIKDFVRPFDLSRAPLLRAGLFRVEPDKHVLVVDMHHIISDGTSVGIFVRDFTALYAGEELPPLPVQYKDFAWRQHSRKESLAFKKQEEYWLKTFSGKLPVLDLPLDFTRPRRQSFEGRVLSFELDGETVEALRKLAAEEGATLFMVLLTVVYVWLWKLSRSETVVVGSPIAGRRHADQEGIIGMFVNSLALKNSPRPEKSFNEFLKEVAQNTLEAYENQEYQFEDLVEKIMNGRHPGRHPVFDVMFALQNLDIPPIALPGLTFTVYGHAHNVSPFDLWMTAEEKEEKEERDRGLAFKLGYSVKLFKEETVRNFVRYFREIVDVVKERKDISLKDIEISHRLLEPGGDIIGGLDEDFDF
jgi:non-ribosomal peptide synthetase component F/methionyl-tRNA formyltransferase/acyl carrier protein